MSQMLVKTNIYICKYLWKTIFLSENNVKKVIYTDGLKCSIKLGGGLTYQFFSESFRLTRLLFRARVFDAEAEGSEMAGPL